jgi:hypothetical protein
MLKGSESMRSYAIASLLDRALRSGHRFRLEFDHRRLERLIGVDAMNGLMPDIGRALDTSSAYDVYTGTLDDHTAPALRKLLLAAESGRERPMNYIKSARILDASGRTVLRIGDHGTFVLFELPVPDRAAFLEDLARRGIPEAVIESVDVDVERLQP